MIRLWRDRDAALLSIGRGPNRDLRLVVEHMGSEWRFAILWADASRGITIFVG